VLLFPTFVLLQFGYFGSTSKYTHRHSPPVPTLIPYGYATLAISLALFLSLLGFRNYSLLDTVERRLYRNFQFLWWRRRRLIFRHGEILALTTDAQPRRGKYGVRWYYRLVAVGLDGRKEPLSNWRRNALDQWDRKARQLAPQFGCEFREGREQSAVSVEDERGTPTLTFSSPPTGKTSAMRIAIVLALAGLWFFLFFIRAHR
jgi:hypothetical protein